MNITIRSLYEGVLAVIAVCFVLVVQGAIPFLTMPTLGQAVWSMGFAESLANGSIFSLKAQDIGIPHPASISFGLAGVWPASLLIRAGMHAGDAYSSVAAFYFLIAFYSAYRVAKGFSVLRPIAILGATLWLSMPVVWAHAGYSMLSWGIALLPFYFWASLKLFRLQMPESKPWLAACFYFVAAMVAVFMDGYTFVMFAVGSSALLAYLVAFQPVLRRHLVWNALPVHIASFVIAYLCYRSYIGPLPFERSSASFFRGWGLDLTYVLIPTRGEHWFADALGLSLLRSNENLFGDASVWSTSFFLPLLLAGSYAAIRIARHSSVGVAFIFVAIFSFYMSLGPSLKVDASRTNSHTGSADMLGGGLMSEDFAPVPTGSAWLSENLPVFSHMRASYRWIALTNFSLWLILIIWIGRCDAKNYRAYSILLVLLICTNIPDLRIKIKENTSYRVGINEIDRDAVKTLRAQLQSNDKVFFFPAGNDFLVNYLAPKAGFRSFNIGGDKNLSIATTYWPESLTRFGPVVGPAEAYQISNILVDNVADALVITYIDLMKAPHIWGLTKDKALVDARKAELAPFINVLRKLPYLELSDTPLFLVVKLQKRFASNDAKARLRRELIQSVSYPIQTRADRKTADVLMQGWHSPEQAHTWSTSNAQLRLPVPNTCVERTCHVLVRFFVFAASPARPVAVAFQTNGASGPWSETLNVTTAEPLEMAIPLQSPSGVQVISISVPNAASPRDLGVSVDGRVLGIGLERIELKPD